jgi:hypothetical protein
MRQPCEDERNPNGGMEDEAGELASFRIVNEYRDSLMVCLLWPFLAFWCTRILCVLVVVPREFFAFHAFYHLTRVWPRFFILIDF